MCVACNNVAIMARALFATLKLPGGLEYLAHDLILVHLGTAAAPAARAPAPPPVSSNVATPSLYPVDPWQRGRNLNLFSGLSNGPRQPMLYRSGTNHNAQVLPRQEELRRTMIEE